MLIYEFIIGYNFLVNNKKQNKTKNKTKQKTKNKKTRINFILFFNAINDIFYYKIKLNIVAAAAVKKKKKKKKFY